MNGEEIKPGYAVMLLGDPAVEGKFYRIKTKEGSQYDTGKTQGTAEFSTVASGSKSGFKNMEALEPPKSPLTIAWYRQWTEDGCEYQMKLKAGTIRFGPFDQPNVGFFDNELNGPDGPDDIYSFWLFTDWFPSIEGNNVTPYTVTPKVRFKGYKFEVEQITDAGEIARLRATQRFAILMLGGVSKV